MCRLWTFPDVGSADIQGAFPCLRVISANQLVTEPRSADRTIAALAQDGHYHTSRHLEVARTEAKWGRNPDDFVQAHVRRLDALRRAGIVERLADGVATLTPRIA